MLSDITYDGQPLEELTKVKLISIVEQFLKEKQQEEEERRRRQLVLNAPYY